MVKLRSALAALALLSACSQGGRAPSAVVQPETASVSGGIGRAREGGAGGQVTLSSVSGDVRISPRPLPATQPPPAPGLPSPGANPRTVEGVETFAPDAQNGLLGDDGATPATALWVGPGGDLTLLANHDAGIALLLDGPLVVEGTLRVGAPDQVDRPLLSAQVGGLRVLPGGRVDGRGADGGAGTGGSGATLIVGVMRDLVVEGTIDTRGGAGSDGGPGGFIDLYAGNGQVMNTGIADSSGGEGRSGRGGDAGGSAIWGTPEADGDGDAYNSGQLVARGGDGALGGGAGAAAYVSGCKNGRAVHDVAGLLDSSGGNATLDGDGGAAGPLAVVASGDRVVSLGRLVARGGEGAVSGAGGAGGFVGVGSVASILRLSGTLGGEVVLLADARGGNGAVGGAGGELRVWVERSLDRLPDPLVVSVVALEATGGDGQSTGGAGGTLELYAYDVSEDPSVPPEVSSTGMVRLDSGVLAVGGAALTGGGGAGGSLTASGATVSVAGITADGGSTVGARGGDGGSVVLFADVGRSTLTGTVAVRGGSGEGAGQPGHVVVDGSTLLSPDGVVGP